MNSVRSNSLSLKYQTFEQLGCKDIKIIKYEFVATTQFLCFYFKSKIFFSGELYFFYSSKDWIRLNNILYRLDENCTCTVVYCTFKILTACTKVFMLQRFNECRKVFSFQKIHILCFHFKFIFLRVKR